MLIDPFSTNRLTSAIIGGAIRVHKATGPGLLESVYFPCLVFEVRQPDRRAADMDLAQSARTLRIPNASTRRRRSRQRFALVIERGSERQPSFSEAAFPPFVSVFSVSSF